MAMLLLLFFLFFGGCAICHSCKDCSLILHVHCIGLVQSCALGLPWASATLLSRKMLSEASDSSVLVSKNSLNSFVAGALPRSRLEELSDTQFQSAGKGTCNTHPSYTLLILESWTLSASQLSVSLVPLFDTLSRYSFLPSFLPSFLLYQLEIVQQYNNVTLQ